MSFVHIYSHFCGVYLSLEFRCLWLMGPVQVDALPTLERCCLRTSVQNSWNNFHSTTLVSEESSPLSINNT